MFCSNCGNKILDDAKTCNKCGKKIVPPPCDNEDFKYGQGESSQSNTGQAVPRTDDVIYDEVIGEELQIINKKNKPLPTVNFFLMQIAFLLPVINIVLMLIWSFGKNVNLNRKSYARSNLIWFIFFCVILLFVILTLVFMGYPISIGVLIKFLKDVINSIPE